MMNCEGQTGIQLKLTDKDKPIVEIVKEAIHPKAPDEPFYLCNLGQLVRKHTEWTTLMPRVKPYYAVKCNDNHLVLKTLAGLGTGFDCASKAEMGTIINLGVAPSNIIFANPAKLASHITAALNYGVQTTTFDNAAELLKLKRLHPQARLLIRLRCDAVKAQCQLGMKFGVLLEDTPKLLSVAKELGSNVVGVSFHVGSGCDDNAVYGQAIAKAHWLFALARKMGFAMNVLDIGGGFPGNDGAKVEQIALIINSALEEFFPPSSKVDVIAEPGRFFVASAFTLITQIHSMREIEAENNPSKFMYYINDGVYGSLNCLLYDHAVVTPMTLKDDDNEVKYNASIWGPTCDGLDLITSDVQLPLMSIGECIYFPNMGAYTLVAATTFNGFPLPKIHYYTGRDTWHRIHNIHRAVGGEEGGSGRAPFIDYVPAFTKAGVGCNRDAVGWGMEDMLHPQINNIPSAY